MPIDGAVRDEVVRASSRDGAARARREQRVVAHRHPHQRQEHAGQRGEPPLGSRLLPNQPARLVEIF